MARIIDLAQEIVYQRLQKETPAAEEIESQDHDDDEDYGSESYSEEEKDDTNT